MKNYKSQISIFLLVLIGCTFTQHTDQLTAKESATKQPHEMKNDEKIYWVNSLRVPCTGVGAQRCLQIQRGETMQPDGWESFYSSIQGFEFEEGYQYQLVVREDSLPAEQVPADASSIQYTLVRVLNKQFDPTVRLNDIWMLETLNGQPIDSAQLVKQPYLEIHLADRQVMGHDGCNNFNGTIRQVDSMVIVLGPIAGTRKMCPDMQIPDQFDQLLNQITTYRIEMGILYLYDQQGNGLMSLGKTD